MTTVDCAPGVRVSARQIEESWLLRSWVKRFGHGWTPRRVEVAAVHSWDGEIKMLQATVTTVNAAEEQFTRAILLRGDTVEILPILITPGGKKHVVLVEEARPALGLTMRAIPAGMVDTNEPPGTATVRELGEEVGGNLSWSRPESLTARRFGRDIPLLVSPGGLDERAFFYVCHARVNSQQFDALQGSVAGNAAEGERTTVRIVPLLGAYKALVTREGVADLKTTTALGLYRS